MVEILYGEVFQIAQLIALLVFIPAYYLISIHVHEVREWKYFLLALEFLLFSTLAAIIREIYLFDVFRILEWIFITFSSWYFACACLIHHRRVRGGDGR